MVHYNDLDSAVRTCLEVSREVARIFGTDSAPVYLGKTDAANTFHVIPLRICCFCWLVMCVQDPADGRWKYFVNKCLPFRASISCSHYQCFSNSLRHLVEYRTNHRSSTNYLDDFLFAAISKIICDWLIRSFLDLCEQISLPVAVEKTEWGTTVIVFLASY